MRLSSERAWTYRAFATSSDASGKGMGESQTKDPDVLEQGKQKSKEGTASRNCSLLTIEAVDSHFNMFAPFVAFVSALQDSCLFAHVSFRSVWPAACCLIE